MSVWALVLNNKHVLQRGHRAAGRACGKSAGDVIGYKKGDMQVSEEEKVEPTGFMPRCSRQRTRKARSSSSAVWSSWSCL
jgi:hypothetical protein